MHPILFKIGSFTLYTHGLLAVLGIVFGSAILFLLAKKSKLDRTYLFDNVVYSVLFGIIGSRITYFIMYRSQFQSPWEIFQLWQGGMVSYGGFLLGGLAFWILFRIQKQPVLKWLDLIGIAFPAGMVLGRIGNVFAGEYDGIATASKFNISGLVPVTLCESIINLFIFIFLLFAYKKISQTREGIIFASSIFLYGLGRFIVDFWRDEPQLILGISLGQIVSLILFLVSGFYIIKLLFFGRKANDEINS